MKNGEKKKNKINEKDEVEQLLQAAQDEILLKISVDSHISSKYLDADLDRRFQILKSRPSVTFHPQSTASQSKFQSLVDVDVDGELKSVLGDDLCARFAALKGSSNNNNNNNNNNGVVVGSKISVDDDDDDNGEDEVEKLIRWAKDAARLDPCPPSDDDDDDGKNSENEDDEEPVRKKEHHK